MRTPFRALLGLAFSPAAAFAVLAAVNDWSDYYEQAQKSLRKGEWSQCVSNLNAALKLRRSSDLRVRTYGMNFVDYLPHYYKGLCLLKQEEYDQAKGEFDAEERAGAVKGSSYEAELVRLRNEARSGGAAAAARKTRAEVQRLIAVADEQRKRKAYDDAKVTLVPAELIAKDLDPELLATITNLKARIAKEEEQAKQLAQRRRDLEQFEQWIADGQRLLDQGKASDAHRAFQEAQRIEPTDPRVAEGLRVAQALILQTTSRDNRRKALAEGIALFQAGRYDEALGPLTEAAADPENFEARPLIDQARRFVDGLRRQKDLRAEIDRLLAKGEKLMNASSYPEAIVAFESALRLDPALARARERKELAERRTGEALFERWLPNQEPVLEVFETRDPVIEAPSLSLQGVASDDRGIQKVEFRVGSVLVGTIVPPPPPAQPARNKLFTREMPLAPGPNTLSVTAFDTNGLSRTVSFSIERRLRFYESAYFLPVALAGAVSLVGIGWGAQRLRRRRAMRLRFNPYIAGAPVLDDEMFYGRGKLTARMLSTLQRNSLMITGERRIGKTTFLHHLKRALEQDDAGDWRFFPVFVDLQGVPEETFFHALMAEIVEALPVSATTRDTLRFRPQGKDFEARDFSHDLPLVLAELRQRTSKKVKLALLIDEVDVLNAYSESVNQRLRGIFMKSFSENLVAVMSGVGIRRRWNSEVSPWYNFFDEIELPPFSREEAEALVREPVAGVFRFEPRAVDRILELSQLRPYLVQKYCVHAVTQMLEDNRSTIRLSDVEAVRPTVEIEARGEAEPEPGELRPVAD